MLLRCVFLFALLLVVGCGKDEPPPPVRIIVEEPEPKQKPVVPAQKTPVDDKEPDPKPKELAEEVRAKLAPCDLSGFGIYAQIDAPVGAKPRQDPATASIEINGIDNYSLSIRRGSADLAKLKREVTKDPQARLLIDESDGFLVQTLDAGSPRYRFHVNVAIEDAPYQVEKLNDATAQINQVRRNFNAARTLKQTPELKTAQASHDTSLFELRGAGANISTAPDGTNTLQIAFSGNTKITDADLKLLQFLPEVSEMDLRINSPLSPEVFDYLKALPRLTRLSLGGAWIGAEALKRAGELTDLRVLRIIDAPVTDAMLPSLADLTELTELFLDGTRIGDKGLHTLQKLKKLKYLHLAGTDVTDKGLASIKEFADLRELSLSDTSVTGAGLSELLGLKSLARLDLSETLIDDAGIEPLFSVPRRLEINLTGTNVSAAGVDKMKMVPGRFSLKRPWPVVEPAPGPVAAPVPIDQLPKADLAALVEKLGGKLTRGEETDGKPIIGIDLHGAKVTDVDLGQLRSAPKLQRLNLEGCKAVSDAGLPYLADLTSLEQLNLSGTEVRGDGLVYLKGLVRLTWLNLDHLVRLTRLNLDKLDPITALTSRQLAPVAGLPNLEVLSFGFPLEVDTDKDHPLLAMLSRMPRLKELHLEDVNLTNRKLAYFKDQRSLVSVNLGGAGRVRDRGLAHLTGLTELNTLVMRNYMGSDAGLANLKAFPKLTTLEIKGPFLTNASLASLGALEQLERLRIDGVNINDLGLPHLRRLDKLVEFSAVGTGISDRGLDALASIKSLEVINLGRTKVTDVGLTRFRENEELRALLLDGADVDGRELKALADLPQLYRLQLSGTKLNDAGVAAVSSLPHLVSLDLSRTAIGDASLEHLKNLRTLVELRLDGCLKLSDKAVDAIKKIPALKRVGLAGTNLSVANFLELRKAGVEVDLQSVSPASERLVP
jgi:Leucine-rich repeat (LRR) protein